MHVTDFQHICKSGKSTVDQEDVKVVGSWSDYTGSATINNANMQGIGNKLFGKIADIQGEKGFTATKRGNDAELTRQRQHTEYVNLEGGEE